MSRYDDLIALLRRHGVNAARLDRSVAIAAGDDFRVARARIERIALRAQD